MGKIQMFMAGIKIFVAVLVAAIALAVIFTPLYLLAYYLFKGTILLNVFIAAHIFLAIVLSGIPAHWFFKYS